MEFQAPLLRVLQEKEVRRVGDDTVIPVDIRVVAATNRNLLQLVEAGKFRMDLYYRLNVLSVVVPPLRNREEDYQEIAGSYLRSTDAGAFERGGAGIFQYFEEVPGLSMAGEMSGN